MNKYVQIFNTSIRENAKTYVNTILSVVSFCVIIYIFAQLWGYIYTNGQPIINGYTLQNMIWYLVAAEIIAYSAAGKYIIKQMGNDVKSGRIVYQLNKPYNYFGYNIVKGASETIYKLVFLIPIGIVFGLLLLGAPPGFRAWHLLPTTFSFLLSACVIASSYSFIGLIVFWLEDAVPFGWVYEKMLMLFGLFFPPEFFPSVLRQFITFSPVYAVYSGPSKLLAQFDWSLLVQVLFAQAFYIALFVGLGLIIYQKATRKVNIHGG